MAKITTKLTLFSSGRTKRKAKALEFSQRIVLLAFIFSLAIVVLISAANFVLLWHGKNAMPQETVTAISTYGGITSGLSFSAYAALSAVRDHSKNKTGVTAAEMAANSAGDTGGV